MAGKLLLDTNAVIAIFANDRSALELLKQYAACFLPCIVLGELHFGANHSSKPVEIGKRIAGFASSIAVLECDVLTAEHYGRIKNELRVAGNPIPENDIWIASIAAQNDLPLMSNDRHFDKVRGLVCVSW